MSNEENSKKTERDEFLEEVDRFVKSRSEAVIGVVGKAAMYETKAHSSADFTGGGRLEPRWVNMDPTSVAKRRQQGFVLPGEVSSKLPNLQMKNQQLMLIPKEQRGQLKRQVNDITRRYEGAVFANDSRSAAKDKGAHLQDFEVTLPNGDKTGPVGAAATINPAPQVGKRAIGAK